MGVVIAGTMIGPNVSNPTDKNASVKDFALPSKIGTSSSERVMSAQVMPNPINADKTCSGVRMRTPSFSKRVALAADIAYWALHGTLCQVVSISLKKRMPVSGFPGEMVM
jgi:hypothetical protein